MENEKNLTIQEIDERIAKLHALIEARSRHSGVRRPKGVGYRLLKKEVDWSGASQLWTIVEILDAIGASKEVLPITAVEAAMERNSALFDITGLKQTATKVWRYYRKQLLDHGVLEEVRMSHAAVIVA